MGQPQRLTPKQQRFVQEYLCDVNATQAALRAGYSPQTAKQIGTENLAKPSIAAAIQEGMDARQQRVTLTQARVVEELAVLSTSDIRHYVVSDTGDLILAEGAPDSAMRAVSSVKKRITWDKEGNKTYAVDFRLWDKPGTLRLSAQHLGMLKEKIEHSGPGGGPIAIQDLDAAQRLTRLEELLAKRG